MKSTRANAPSPLVLPRPPLLTVDDDGRRYSASTVSTRTTGFSNSTLLSSPPDTPRTVASAPSLDGRPSGEKKRGTRLGKKKSSSFLGFLTVKEPSLQALERYEEAQRRDMALAARETGRPMNAGLSGVSRAKMPASVPKVNSKWDGLPKVLSEERKGKGHDRDDDRSVSSAPSSRSGPLTPANPHGGSSSDSLDFFSLQLSRGYNQPRQRGSLFGAASTRTGASPRPPRSARGSSTSSLLDLRSTRSRPISIDSHPPLPPLPDHMRQRSASSMHNPSIHSRPVTPMSCASSLSGAAPGSSGHGAPIPRSSVQTRSIRSSSSCSSKPFVVVEEDVDNPAVPPLVTPITLEDEGSTSAGPTLERIASMPSLVPPKDPLKIGPSASTTDIRPTTATTPHPYSEAKVASAAPPPPRSILVSKPSKAGANGRGASPGSSGWKTLLRRIKNLHGGRSGGATS